jgi:hypothetical protein
MVWRERVGQLMAVDKLLQLVRGRLYTISSAQVDDLGSFLRRFCSEQVLFEERFERFVASEPFMCGILSVRLRISAVPVLCCRQGFALFVGSHRGVRRIVRSKYHKSAVQGVLFRRREVFWRPPASAKTN